MNALVNAETGENARTMAATKWNALSKQEQSDWSKRAHMLKLDAIKSKNGINHLRQILSDELHDIAKVEQIYLIF
jgi:hypothetical protein